MNLPAELKEQGRRNFLKAVAGSPILAGLAGAVAMQGPKSGGPVRAGIIGVGGEGKTLLGQIQKGWIDLRAITDINPTHAAAAAEGLAGKGWAKPTVYTEFKDMLAKEDLEAVIIATPLWTHADIAVACMEAGKHVLCEKMMAYDVASCQRMLDTSRKTGRILEIGYQRFYCPAYQSSYADLIKTGKLGDIFYIKTLWHRNASWRKDEKAPTPDFDPRPWGYENWDHLINWRLYRKHSRGLLAELGSHQISIANWFYDSVPDAVYTSGSTALFKDGREVDDHVYATFEYPGGRTATFTSIQSNKFEDNYEEIQGTKGTLILKGEGDAMLFTEDEAKAVTTLETSKRTTNAIVDASESRSADAKGRTVAAAASGITSTDPLLPYRNEIAHFCNAVRTGVPVKCGPVKAMGSASACIRAYEAGDKKTRLTLA
jgi:predicted dehydrogenase